jgi:MFS family permease
MVLTQTASAMVLTTVPVLAPEIARDTGIDASAVGAYTALVFSAAMFSSALSGTLIDRLGAVRANQAVLLASALALLVTLTARLPTVALSAVLVGAGYGPNTPTGSQVLARVTPAHMRGMVFSIKQSGAPLGGMLAGLMLPVVAVSFGWQAAIVLASALSALAVLAVEPLRRRLDTPRSRGADTATARPSTFAAMREVLSIMDLRRLTIAAFVLMILHTCFQSFTVAFLVEHVDLSLPLAGGLFAVLCAAGAVARVGLGWAADRLQRPREVLILTSLAGAIAAGLFSAFSPHWSLPSMVAISALGGAATSGWYGVFLAEVSRRSPPGRVGLATGGALFFVYSSIVVGPLVFSALVALGGSYPLAYRVLAMLTLVASVNLLRMRAAAY